jgi:WD40 repeat protein
MILPSQLSISKKFHYTGHAAGIYSLSAGLQPNTVLSGGGDGVIAEWRLDAEAPAQGLAMVKGNVFTMLHIAEKELLIAGDLNGVVHITDLAAKKELVRFTYTGGAIYALTRLNATTVLAGAGNGNIYLLDLQNLTEINCIEVSDKPVRSITYAKQRNELLVACSDFNIYVFNATDYTLKHVLSGHDNSVFCLALSPDGSRLISGSRDAQLRVWDVENDYQCIMQIPAHMYTVNDIVFSPNGRLMATAGRDKHIKIWDAEGLHLLKVIDFEKFGGHINSVNKLFWSNWNNYLISCGDDRTVMVWDIEENGN